MTPPPVSPGEACKPQNLTADPLGVKGASQPSFQPHHPTTHLLPTPYNLTTYGAPVKTGRVRGFFGLPFEPLSRISPSEGALQANHVCAGRQDIAARRSHPAGVRRADKDRAARGGVKGARAGTTFRNGSDFAYRREAV
jgi:hypothetical protein